MLFAVATARLVAVNFEMLDVSLHQYLKNMEDALGADIRRRRVNFYVGVFYPRLADRPVRDLASETPPEGLQAVVVGDG